MLLPEDDVLLGAVERPPSADAPLQRTPNAGADLGMAPPDLVENGDRPQARGALEQTTPPRRAKQRQADRAVDAFFCDGSRGSSSMR